MCHSLPWNGAPRIIVAGLNPVYEDMRGGQYAYPDGEHTDRKDGPKPVYAIRVRRKPHAPLY